MKYEPKLTTHIHEEQPKSEVVGLVNVDLKETEVDSFGQPIGFTKHENFDLPLVQEPTLTEKAAVGINNAVDRTAVELTNAKEQAKAGFINTAIDAKELGQRAGTRLEAGADLAGQKLKEGKENVDRTLAEKVIEGKLLAKEAELNLRANAMIAQEKMYEGAEAASEKFNQVKDNISKQATATLDKAETKFESMKTSAQLSALKAEARLEANLNTAEAKINQTEQALEHKVKELYASAQD